MENIKANEYEEIKKEENKNQKEIFKKPEFIKQNKEEKLKKKGVIVMRKLFIEYPKCSTCKKAKKWLEDNKIEFNDRHIVENTPTVEELKEWIKMSGKDIKKWFNTSGLKYKELNLKDRLPLMSDEEKIELLSTDGMLIKRPILVLENKVLIGFKEEEWKEEM